MSFNGRKLLISCGWIRNEPKVILTLESCDAMVFSSDLVCLRRAQNVEAICKRLNNHSHRPSVTRLADIFDWPDSENHQTFH